MTRRGRDRRQGEHAEHGRDDTRQRADDPGQMRTFGRDTADRAERDRGGTATIRYAEATRRARGAPSTFGNDVAADAHACTTSTGQPSGGAAGDPGPARARRRPSVAGVGDHLADRGPVLARPAPHDATRGERGRADPRAARLAAASGAAPRRSTTSATPSAGGGSCSRTTISPRRALVGQWTRRAGSPGA